MEVSELAAALAEEKLTMDEAQLNRLQNRENMAKDYRAVKLVLIKVTDKKRGVLIPKAGIDPRLD